MLVFAAQKSVIKAVSNMHVVYALQQTEPDVGRCIAMIDQCVEAIAVIQQNFLLSECAILFQPARQ
jgi:hypothetical protein